MLITGERGAAFPGIPACKGALKAWGAQVPGAVLETFGLDLPSSMPFREKLPPGGQGLFTGDPAAIASHQSLCTCSKVGFISIPSDRAVLPTGVCVEGGTRPLRSGAREGSPFQPGSGSTAFSRVQTNGAQVWAGHMLCTQNVHMNCKDLLFSVTLDGVSKNNPCWNRRPAAGGGPSSEQMEQKLGFPSS